MNAETFTRGPWAISKHATPEHSPQYGIYAEDASGWDIATVHGENAAANAVLIAAAPKLLALLNEAQEYLDILADDAREAGYPVRAENSIQLSKRCREAITEANLIQL